VKALVLALYLAVGVIQTAPLAWHLRTSIPFGNDTVATVPRLNLWTLWWNEDRFLHAYRGYWQAPIFDPEPNALAYNEPEWLTGLVASPLWWIGATPAFVYDAVVLAALTLTGLAGYRLARTLGIRRRAAVGAGLLAEMLPTIADQLGVLQSITVVPPLIMTLAALARFGRRGGLAPAIGVALWFAASFHTSSNMALFFAPMVALGVVVLAGERLVRLRTLGTLAVAGAVGVALIAPVAVVQSRVLATMPRHDERELAGSSAHLGTYTEMAATNLLRRRPPDRKEATLFPGFGLPILAAVGVGHGLRRRRLRRWTLYALLAVALCGVLSFGPLLDRVELGAVLGAPYHLLWRAYPGFRFARNLWRFGAVGQVFLAALAGLGLAACCARRRALLGAAVTLAVAAELLATPIPLLDLGEDGAHAEWVQWLAHAPPETTVIHLPMPTGLVAEDFERTTYWMDCQMYHHRRIANGYGAYVPSRTALLMQVMPEFPDAASIRALQYFGIDHVAASADWSTPERAERVRQWGRWVVPELVTTDMTIYRIVR